MLKPAPSHSAPATRADEALFSLHYTPRNSRRSDEGQRDRYRLVDDTKPAPVRIEYAGGSLVVDPDCLADPDEPGP